MVEGLFHCSLQFLLMLVREALYRKGTLAARYHTLNKPITYITPNQSSGAAI